MARKKHRSSLAREVAKIKQTLEKEKPETKSTDILSVDGNGDPVTIAGPYNGIGNAPYDITGKFIQGVQNMSQLEGNYCKLLSMDLRIMLENVNHPSNYSRIRLMVIRIPNAVNISSNDVFNQILEYGLPATYNKKSYCSPYKKNSNINGGYDIMYDKLVHLSAPGATYAPQNAIKFLRVKKTWKKGLELRFSGSQAALSLEKNRIYLFAYDIDVTPTGVGGSSKISFISRMKYFDE